MVRWWGRRVRRPLFRFLGACALLCLGIAGAAAAQPVEGWRLHATSHFALYVVEGTAGARDAAQVGAQLEHLYAQVLAPLRMPPATIIVPLYPSARRFHADWWQFATLGHGDLVHAWGDVYEGGGSIPPYMVTRAAVADAYPRAIPLLRWGFGDALGDRAAGVDSHRHVRALLASGRAVPEILSIVAPSDFGDALPVSYPVAVSFMAFLLDTYGPARTAAFVNRVEFRYYEFSELFEAAFGAPLSAAEAAWRRQVNAAGAPPLDLSTYLAVTRFVYRTTLAGSPSRLMLEPQGAVVVTEAMAAVLPLRRLDLETAAARMAAAERADEEAERRQRLTTGTARGAIAALVVAPILFAVGWLIWPAVRARLADAKRRKPVARTSEQGPGIRDRD